jgi:hypothetical protein
MTKNPRLSPQNRRAVAAASRREVAQAVRSFLAQYHPQGRRGITRVGGKQNLWREISSLTLLQLVAFVENKFQIQVRPIDFAPQNFSTIATIARFVSARRPQPTPSAG